MTAILLSCAQSSEWFLDNTKDDKLVDTINILVKITCIDKENIA